MKIKESTVNKVQKFHHFVGKNGYIIIYILSACNMIIGNMDGAIYSMLLCIFLILMKRK